MVTHLPSLNSWRACLKSVKEVFELKSQLKIHDWSVNFIDRVAKHSDP